MPSGIDPYMSPNLCTRNLLPGEHPWAWAHTDAGSEAFSLAALGLPFAPEDPDSPVLLLDAVCARGMEDGEVSSLLASHGIVADRTVWQELERRGLVTAYSSVPWPEDGPEIPADMESRYRAAQSEIRLLETASGSRLAVVPSYSIDINGAEQMALAGAFDWASGQALRVLPECPAQVSLVPRTTEDGRLRSVALLSCTISDEEHLRLRLRPGAGEDGRIPERYVLKRHGRRDIRLRPRFDGGDVLLEIPVLEGWEFAWIAIGK